jgi:hypothetical protein
MMNQELELWQEIWQVVASRAAVNVGTGQQHVFAEAMAALVSVVAIAIVTSENEVNQKPILDTFVSDVCRTIPLVQDMLKELS